MKTLKEILSDSYSSPKAIPAFNIDSFEIYQAVESVVTETNFPCIVQLSSGEDKFIQAERLFILVKKAQIDGLPIFLNMDHGKDTSRLKELASLGFDMLHFDASDFDFQTALDKTSQFIKEVKEINPEIIIESEFNKIQLSGTDISSDSFTNPQQAFDFLAKSKADILAVSIGNLHGVDLDKPEVLDLKLLKQLKEKLPDQMFTLHGASGITSGELSSSLNLGIVKVNINTDLRLQFLKSIKSNLDSQKTEKIYKILDPVVTDLKKVIKEKFSCLM